jgi:type IX secretion system PorP/SprF family membrane protein
MKKTILLAVFNLVCFLTIAQSDIRLNNYWVNPQYINPASVYDKYQAVFSMAARKQWFGFPGAPTTFFLSGSTFLEDYNTQLGLMVVQDKIGFTSTSNIDLTYAYAIMFQRDWQLHLGLGGNFQSQNYDLDKINVEDNSDTYYFDRLKKENSFNSDLGVEITNKNFKFGASSKNIFSLFTSENAQKPNTNFIYTRYRQISNNIVDFGLGVCGIQYSNIYQAEFNATSYFKIPHRSGLLDTPDLFNLGMYYRTGSELGFIFGFDISESIHVSYSYDYHLGGIRKSSYGTNEIMITFNLLKKSICRNCWY